MNQQTEKKLYEKPGLEVVEINLTDIIITSSCCDTCCTGDDDTVNETD